MVEINRGYTQNHKGADADYGPDNKIPIIGTPIRLLFSKKTFGYDVNGNRLDDWAVGYETSKHDIFTFSHLVPESLPVSLTDMVNRGYVGVHVKTHPAWGDHSHVMGMRPASRFVSISQAERDGLTFDPVPYIIDSVMAVTHEMLKEKGRLVRYEGSNDIHFVFKTASEFDNLWSSVETKKFPVVSIPDSALENGRLLQYEGDSKVLYWTKAANEFNNRWDLVTKIKQPFEVTELKKKIIRLETKVRNAIKELQ